MIKFLLTVLFTATTMLGITQQQVFIKFENIANNKQVLLDSSKFTNKNNEPYQITKLKYYISNVSFSKNSKNKNVQLIDASKQGSFKINLPKQKPNTLYFQIGVDSVLNCSGAQTGALDPLNGMFWTWNSGYINFKLEGINVKDSSKIEHHIGGYKVPYKTMHSIKINLPNNYLATHKTIVIQLNIDKYWNAKNEMTISEHPTVMSTGELAKNAAENFEYMFTLKQ